MKLVVQAPMRFREGRETIICEAGTVLEQIRPDEVSEDDPCFLFVIGFKSKRDQGGMVLARWRGKIRQFKLGEDVLPVRRKRRTKKTPRRS